MPRATWSTTRARSTPTSANSKTKIDPSSVRGSDNRGLSPLWRTLIHLAPGQRRHGGSWYEGYANPPGPWLQSSVTLIENWRGSLIDLWRGVTVARSPGSPAQSRLLLALLPEDC